MCSCLWVLVPITTLEVQAFEGVVILDEENMVGKWLVRLPAMILIEGGEKMRKNDKATN